MLRASCFRCVRRPTTTVSAPVISAAASTLRVAATATAHRRACAAPAAATAGAQSSKAEQPDPNYGQGGAAIPDDVTVDQVSYNSYVPMMQFESEVRIKMQSQLGEGTYDLYRALYKDLCDEMRREIHARAPPPVQGWVAAHEPLTRFITFTRTKREGEDFEVVVHAQTLMEDPKTINEVMQFLNWFPLEVLIRREGYIMHLSCCYVEASPQIRNVRVYREAEGEDLCCSMRDVVNTHRRDVLRYDGPFMGHLELDVQTELFDTMLDVGIDCYFLRQCADWISYFEHVEYARWSMSMMDAIAPQVRHPKPAEPVVTEEDLVAREERMALDQVAEEWMPSRNL